MDDNLSTVHFADLCNITADMTSLKSSIRPRTNHRGAKYYTVSYDIVLLFGLTELKAQIAWTHNVSHRFPLKKCYTPDAILQGVEKRFVNDRCYKAICSLSASEDRRPSFMIRPCQIED